MPLGQPSQATVQPAATAQYASKPNWESVVDSVIQATWTVDQGL